MNKNNSSDSLPAQGWQGNPSSRGTFDILSSCLVVILASTWTVLHLNVPAARDAQTTRFFRKLKWMCFTIMFPEFMFAHAMEERLMANAVLQRLAETNAKVKTTGPKKIAVASTIGNLEWRGLVDFIADALFRKPPVEANFKSAREDPQRPSRIVALAPASSQDLPVSGQSLDNETANSPSGIANAPSDPSNKVRPEQISSEHLPLEQVPPKHAASMRLSSHSIAPDSISSVHTSSEKPSSNLDRPKQVHEWTITHAIFANMGGFRLVSHSSNLPSKGPHNAVTHQTIDGFELAHLLTKGTISSIPDISKAAILDKSKSDTFARWLAIFQLLWLLIELIARQIEDLPSSQLEIATLAFACCSILTYLAVRDKPKDVAVSLDIPVDMPLPHKIRVDPLFEQPRSFFLEVFFFRYWKPINYRSVVFLTPNAYRFRKSREQWIKWRPKDITGERITNDNYLVRNYLSHPMSGWMVIGSIVFGGIHCVAWNHYFPSDVERILWRVSALVTTLAPLLLPIIDRGANTIRRLIEKLGILPSTFAKVVVNGWNILVPALILVCYVLLRLCILVLVFASLRKMPPGVYNTTWTRYLLSVH